MTGRSHARYRRLFELARPIDRDSLVTRLFSSSASGATIDLQGGTDTVTLAGGAVTVANVENIIGSAGWDIITIQNTGGTTNITGGASGDTITAGAGVDHFIYVSTADSNSAGGTDTISGFNAAPAGDTIDLSAIDADATSGGTNEAFSWIGLDGPFTAAG